MNTPQSKMTLRGSTFGRLLGIQMKSFISKPVYAQEELARKTDRIADRSDEIRSERNANSNAA